MNEGVAHSEPGANLAEEGDGPGADSGAPQPATLVRNSTWTLGSQAVVLALGAVLSVYAIRTVSVSGWGAYSTALALVSILTVFGELGLSTHVLREMTADFSRSKDLVSSALTAVITTGVPALVVCIPLALLLGYPTSTVVLVAIGAPMVLLIPAMSILRAAFTAHRVLVYPAAFDLLQAVSLTVIGMTLLLLGSGVRGLMIATLAASAFALVAGAVFARRRLGLRGLAPAPARNVRRFLIRSVPVAGIGIVSIVYARLDILLLSKLATDADVAQYSVAYTVVRFSWVVPSVVASAFFPLLAELLRSQREQARESFFLLVRLFFFLSVPISIFLAASSTTLLPLVFGDAYGESASVLQVMAWTSLLGFQNYALWYGILACGKEGQILPLMIAGLGINLVLNLILIPALGAPGAALALVLSDLWVIVTQVVILQRHLFVIPYRELLVKPIIAIALVAGPTLALVAISPLTGATFGALAFMLLLHFLGYIDRDEWAPITGPLGELRARALRRRAR